MARALVPTRPTPAQVRRRVCGLVLMLIPSFTLFAIVRSGTGNGWPSVHLKRKPLAPQLNTAFLLSNRPAMERVAAICNLVLLASVCRALLDQYPHPEEEGVAAFALLTELTPILSAAVLFHARPSIGRWGLQRGGSAAGTVGD